MFYHTLSFVETLLALSVACIKNSRKSLPFVGRLRSILPFGDTKRFYILLRIFSSWRSVHVTVGGQRTCRIVLGLGTLGRTENAKKVLTINEALMASYESTADAGLTGALQRKKKLYQLSSMSP